MILEILFIVGFGVVFGVILGLIFGYFAPKVKQRAIARKAVKKIPTQDKTFYSNGQEINLKQMLENELKQTPKQQ